MGIGIRFELSSSLQERLLDRYKLLKWMVEKLESMKSSNEAGQYLYLQLVIKVSLVIG